MSVSGTLFGLEANSQGRLNRKTLFIGTGAQIAAVPLTSPATLFLSTTTESGYVTDELYSTKADGSGRISLRRAHKHDAATDAAGGSMYDIDTANAGTRIAIDRLTKGGDFVAYREGSAAVDSTRVDNAIVSNAVVTRLRTTTTLNNLTQLVDGGISLSMASKSEWRTKMQISHSTNILWRMGVNMEGVDVASNATENKYGMEGCDSDGTNIRVICCNGGGSRTNTNSAIAMNIGMRGYAMYYTPGTNVVWKDSAGNIQTLSSSVPSSGSIASDRLLKYGIKCATSGGTEKAMYIARDCLYGKTADTLWVA